jgi:hypothetical protein
MVKRASQLTSFATCFVTFFALSSTSIANARDYKIGDRAEEDIVCPSPMVVVDNDATEVLKEKEARRVPVVYRYYPHVIDEVETAFHATFAHTQSNFLDAVDGFFHRRVLDPDQITSPEFKQLVVESFQKQNVLMPVDAALASIWASGGSSAELESAIAGRLRETMRHYVRSDTSPDDIWVGSTLRLVSLADNENTTARLVDERGMNLSKTNFVSLQRTKTELQDAFPAEQRALGKYVVSFIKPNCLMEADLTREMRSRRTVGIMAADHYEAGQLIAKRGQVIDKKTKAALDQIKPPAAAVVTPAPVPTPVAATLPTPARQTRDLDWTVVAVGGGVLIVLVFVWALARRRTTPTSLLPVPLKNAGGELYPVQSNPSHESWKERALIAEERAQRAQDMVRAGLLAHLAQWLSDRLTRKLVTQRAQLMDAHQKAAVEMAELEARLMKIQAPLQDRLQAYERRIAELEKDLQMKGEENRALTRAKIQLIRKQLEMEREKSRVEFN